MNCNLLFGSLPRRIAPIDLVIAPPGQLDSLSTEFLTVWPNYETSLSSLGFVRHESIPGYPGMFLYDIAPVQEGDATARVRVTAIGLKTLSDNKFLRRNAARGQVSGIGPTEKLDSDDKPIVDDNGNPEYEQIVTPSGISETWNIFEPTTAFTDSYYSLTKPDLSAQGTAQAPADPPPTPPNLWANYQGQTRLNHPNGWILDQRADEEIIPGYLWRVDDSYSFIQPFQPA